MNPSACPAACWPRGTRWRWSGRSWHQTGLSSQLTAKKLGWVCGQRWVLGLSTRYPWLPGSPWVPVVVYASFWFSIVRSTPKRNFKYLYCKLDVAWSQLLQSLFYRISEYAILRRNIHIYWSSTTWQYCIMVILFCEITVAIYFTILLKNCDR